MEAIHTMGTTGAGYAMRSEKEENSPKKIFLIEDDSDIRNSILSIFEEEGIPADWAGNGEEALHKLRIAKDKPDLILLDLRLPIKDGWQFREEQAGDPLLQNIPVIVISADGRLHEKTTRLGVRDVLRKPIDIDELIKAVRKNLH